MMLDLLFWYWLCGTEWGAFIVTLSLCGILVTVMYHSIYYVVRLTKGENR
jgi:hypothetical protein